MILLRFVCGSKSIVWFCLIYLDLSADQLGDQCQQDSLRFRIFNFDIKIVGKFDSVHVMQLPVDFFPEDTESVLELETLKKLLHEVEAQRCKGVLSEFWQKGMFILEAHLFFVVIALFIDKVENFGFEFGLDFLEKS